jgi:hypothetical protein
MINRMKYFGDRLPMANTLLSQNMIANSKDPWFIFLLQMCGELFQSLNAIFLLGLACLA